MKVEILILRLAQDEAIVLAVERLPVG